MMTLNPESTATAVDAEEQEFFLYLSFLAYSTV